MLELVELHLPLRERRVGLAVVGEVDELHRDAGGGLGLVDLPVALARSATPILTTSPPAVLPPLLLGVEPGAAHAAVSARAGSSTRSARRKRRTELCPFEAASATRRWLCRAERPRQGEGGGGLRVRGPRGQAVRSGISGTGSPGDSIGRAGTRRAGDRHREVPPDLRSFQCRARYQRIAGRRPHDDASPDTSGRVAFRVGHFHHQRAFAICPVISGKCMRHTAGEHLHGLVT